MEALIEKSIDFIRDNLKDKGLIFVGFSGGKDSIVTADLMRRSGVEFKLYYIRVSEAYHLADNQHEETLALYAK